jgi:hypothetical protein
MLVERTGGVGGTPTVLTPVRFPLAQWSGFVCYAGGVRRTSKRYYAVWSRTLE